MTLQRDPRLFQLAFLGSFLVLGELTVGLGIPLWEPPLILATVLATQWLFARVHKLADLGLRSALITGLGLTLLLRTDLPVLAALAAAFAIASKFLLRVRGKHVFNPTCLALATFMLATPRVWCSPSQWGENTALYGWFCVLGLTVVVRAMRSDVSLTFLAAWVALKLGRILYLGQRPAVLLHQLSAGSLILFTFFMISDPKTTPSSRGARILFATSIAGLAFYLQHARWIQNGPIWALFLLAPLVPVLDRLFPAAAYVWPSAPDPLSPRSTPCPPVSA